MPATLVPGKCSQPNLHVVAFLLCHDLTERMCVLLGLLLGDVVLLNEAFVFVFSFSLNFLQKDPVSKTNHTKE